MSGVNKSIILGRLGDDPTIRYLPSGAAVANITVATSEKWKDKNTGQQNEEVEWHKITFFNKLAEIVGQYLKKGSQIYVEGKLKTRKWEKEGQTHYSTEIVASQMQMLDSKPQQGGGQQQGGYADQYRQQAPQQAPMQEQGHHDGHGNPTADARQEPPQQGALTQAAQPAEQKTNPHQLAPAGQPMPVLPDGDGGIDDFSDDIPF